MKTWIIAIAVAVTWPALAAAHEGHTHKALGTITSVQGNTVEIKTTAGKPLTVVLVSKTTVTRGRDKLDAAALKAGERVSVEYVEVAKVMTAHSLKLGATPPAAKK
jgi:hypothetical protein